MFPIAVSDSSTRGAESGSKKYALPSNGLGAEAVEVCTAEEDDIHRNVVRGQLYEPTKFW